MSTDRARRTRTLNVNYQKGKGGKNIAAPIYDAIKRAILASVPARGEGILFRDLPEEVARRASPELLRGRSVPWYTATIKLDLEARGLIQRVPGVVPQRLLRGRR
jgi:hypothetical protein